MAAWRRYKRQEDGRSVYRWFEKGYTIASVVQGYFPNEANIRITGRGFSAIEVRGHKAVLLKLSDEALKQKFDNYIRSEKARKRKPLRRRRK